MQLEALTPVVGTNHILSQISEYLAAFVAVQEELLLIKFSPQTHRNISCVKIRQTIVQITENVLHYYVIKLM